MGEGVSEFRVIRRIALAEARVVRRDDMVAVGQGGNEVAEHVRRGRETVQQQHDRRLGRAGLAIEDLDAIDRRGPVMGDHRAGLCGGLRGAGRGGEGGGVGQGDAGEKRDREGENRAGAGHLGLSCLRRPSTTSGLAERKLCLSVLRQNTYRP